MSKENSIGSSSNELKSPRGEKKILQDEYKEIINDCFPLKDAVSESEKTQSKTNGVNINNAFPLRSSQPANLEENENAVSTEADYKENIGSFTTDLSMCSIFESNSPDFVVESDKLQTSTLKVFYDDSNDSIHIQNEHRSDEFKKDGATSLLGEDIMEESDNEPNNREREITDTNTDEELSKGEITYETDSSEEDNFEDLYEELGIKNLEENSLGADHDNTQTDELDFDENLLKLIYGNEDTNVEVDQHSSGDVVQHSSGAVVRRNYDMSLESIMEGLYEPNSTTADCKLCQYKAIKEGRTDVIGLQEDPLDILIDIPSTSDADISSTLDTLVIRTTPQTSTDLLTSYVEESDICVRNASTSSSEENANLHTVQNSESSISDSQEVSLDISEISSKITNRKSKTSNAERDDNVSTIINCNLISNTNQKELNNYENKVGSSEDNTNLHTVQNSESSISDSQEVSLDISEISSKITNRKSKTSNTNKIKLTDYSGNKTPRRSRRILSYVKDGLKVRNRTNIYAKTYYLPLGKIIQKTHNQVAHLNPTFGTDDLCPINKKNMSLEEMSQNIQCSLSVPKLDAVSHLISLMKENHLRSLVIPSTLYDSLRHNESNEEYKICNFLYEENIYMKLELSQNYTYHEEQNLDKLVGKGLATTISTNSNETCKEDLSDGTKPSTSSFTINDSQVKLITPRKGTCDIIKPQCSSRKRQLSSAELNTQPEKSKKRPKMIEEQNRNTRGDSF